MNWQCVTLHTRACLFSIDVYWPVDSDKMLEAQPAAAALAATEAKQEAAAAEAAALPPAYQKMTGEARKLKQWESQHTSFTSAFDDASHPIKISPAATAVAAAEAHWVNLQRQGIISDMFVFSSERLELLQSCYKTSHSRAGEQSAGCSHRCCCSGAGGPAASGSRCSGGCRPGGSHGGCRGG